MIDKSSLAQDPSTPTNTLNVLSKDEQWRVRCNVAGNPSTTFETLASMSKDRDYLVRRKVALNPNTPPEILTTLIWSEGEYLSVIKCAACNPSTSQDDLRGLRVHSDYEVRWNVAANPNAPYGIWIDGLGRLLP